jgi:hypothetical protein
MTQRDKDGDIDPVRGQPIEEVEKNLSRHATKDSSPPIDEQSRTSVKVDDATSSSGNDAEKTEQGGG